MRNEVFETGSYHQPSTLHPQPPLSRFTLRSTPVTGAKSPLAAAKITYDTAHRIWILEETYRYADNNTFAITIPAGFNFDLSSIPRLIWPCIAPFELSVVAPLIHDFIYHYRGKLPRAVIEPYRTFSRADTDALFKRIMDAEHVDAWRSTAAYRAVRTFGWLYWH